MTSSKASSRGHAPEAQTAAGARTAHIALVDGERLAALLIEHELGVSHETVKIPKLDIDFFDAL